MHRSGTSVAARLHALLGAHLGPPGHRMRADASNARGYWEHQLLTDLNDEILCRLGGSWHEPPELPAGWERAPELGDLRRAAREIVAADFGPSPFFAWKDPRTSLTWPFWRPVLPPVAFAVCVRSPLEVARSLAERDGFDAARSGALWLAYTHAALVNSAGAPRHWLFFEDVVAQPRRALDRLAAFLGRSESARDPAVRRELRAYVERDLRHHRSALVETVDEPGLPFEARSLYLALRLATAPRRGAARAEPPGPLIEAFAEAARNARRARDAAAARLAESERAAALREVRAAEAQRIAERRARDDLVRTRRALVRTLTRREEERDAHARESGRLAAAFEEERARAERDATRLGDDLARARRDLARLHASVAELQQSGFWHLAQLAKSAECRILPSGTRAARAWRWLSRRSARALAPRAPAESRSAAAGAIARPDLPPLAAGAPAATPVACTVVSKNYLALARVFAESFLEHHPEGRVFALLVDRPGGSVDPAREPFELVPLEALDLPDPAALCFKYSILELNTAVKPRFFEYLLRRHGCETLAFFDPDVLVLDRLDDLYGEIARRSLVVTPHITHPYDDDRHPGEIEILQAGVFNLGFLGMANRPETRRFLTWWGARLADRCALEPEAGMHVDQKWVDLAPAFFEDVHVLRDPEYNVAYWNLHERGARLAGRGSKLALDGRRLAFFHFSGFDPDRPGDLSKHQDRFRLADFPVLRPLFADYRERLLAAGHAETRRLAYGYAHFHDGTRIPDAARTLYRRLGEGAARFGDPFDPGARGSFREWLNEPAEEDPGGGPPVSRLWLEIHRRRADLRRAFPDLFGVHREAYLKWVRDSGLEQEGIDPCFAPGDAPARVASPASPVPGLGARLYRSLLHPREREIKALVRRATGGDPRVRARLRALRDRLRQTALPEVHPGRGAPESPRPFGVNLAGYVRSELGVGEGLRAEARSFEAGEVPFVLNEVRDEHHSANVDTTYTELSETNPFAVNVLHVNADQVAVFAQQRGGSWFRGRYNVGYWAWELPEFPSAWWGSFRYFDEIWVPSRFVQDAVASVSPIPVVRVPHCLPARLERADVGRAHFGLPEDHFVFLFAFDACSFLERKNPLGLVRAFRRAFSPDEPVTLVLKCAHPEAAPEEVRALRREAGSAGVRLLEDVLPRPEMNALLASADCYVSLHRSEGFGLTLAEAMCLGLPVIATGWSGNTDFMDGANSMLVRHRLVELERDCGPYRAGSSWAEPDLDHAAELLRRVRREPVLAAQLGRRAREDFERQLAPTVVGRAVARRLLRIAEARRSLFCDVPAAPT